MPNRPTVAALLCVAALAMGCSPPKVRVPPIAFSAVEGDILGDDFEFRQSAWVTGLAPNGQIDVSPAGVAEEIVTLQPLVDVVRTNYQDAGWGTQVTYQSVPVEIMGDAAHDYCVDSPYPEPQGEIRITSTSAGTIWMWMLWGQGGTNPPPELNGWSGTVQEIGTGNARTHQITVNMGGEDVGYDAFSVALREFCAAWFNLVGDPNGEPE